MREFPYEINKDGEWSLTGQCLLMNWGPGLHKGPRELTQAAWFPVSDQLPRAPAIGVVGLGTKVTLPHVAFLESSATRRKITDAGVLRQLH